MKYLALIATVFSVQMLFAATPPVEYVKKYENAESQTLEIPSTFAQGGIDITKVAAMLKNKRIYQVDLVYTQYRKSPDFDQKALNEARKAALLKSVPDIAVDAPNWRWVEQTGAKTADQARDYFHGFVVYYTDEFGYEELSGFLGAFQHDFETSEINNTEGGSLTATSGSVIKIPENAVVDKHGNPVKGAYTLKYREYRNPAEIALSGIPMGYREQDQSYQFSSVGMYELRAEQNGEELKLQKPVTVDFNCTDTKEGVAFYQMDDDSGDWKKIEQLQPEAQDQAPVVAPEAIAIQEIVAPVGFIAMNSDSWDWGLNDRQDMIIASFSKSSWKKIEDTLMNSAITGKLIDLDKDKRTFKLPIAERQAFLEILDVELGWLNGGNARWDNAMAVPGSKTNGTLLGAGSKDPGHTYPNMVRGLNSPEFGVYNCDQIYRIGTPLTVQPTYVDDKTGAPIKEQHVACLMDLTYNGSFSFDPKYITCNQEGRNALLLFTKDKKVYAILPSEFKSAIAENKTSPKFRLKDMTDHLSSPEDLKTYLSL